MSDIWTPGKPKKKANRVVRSQFVINFEFNQDETAEQIIEKLDATLNKERKRAVEAICKLKGIKVNWNEN